MTFHFRIDVASRMPVVTDRSIGRSTAIDGAIGDYRRVAK
jgi:hypothetical protein